MKFIISLYNWNNRWLGYYVADDQEPTKRKRNAHAYPSHFQAKVNSDVIRSQWGSVTTKVQPLHNGIRQLAKNLNGRWTPSRRFTAAR